MSVWQNRCLIRMQEMISMTLGEPHQTGATEAKLVGAWHFLELNKVFVEWEREARCMLLKKVKAEHG